MSAPANGSWRVGPGEAGARLDRALAERLNLPRNQVERWIADGLVAVDGRAAAKGGLKLAAGTLVSWQAPAPATQTLVPERGELDLLHEDDSLLVIDKPPGLVVHPGAGRSEGTLVHRLLSRFPELAGIGGPGRPGIVHRIDRGTSGLLLVARTRAAYTALTRAFAERAIEKRYLAIVQGRPKSERGEIDAPIGRHPSERKRMAVTARGRPARTRWRTIASAGGVSLLEVEILTGRTHQIRVHLRHLGHPLIGDPVYGAKSKLRSGDPPRPALHAWRLALAHPSSGAPVRFEAPVPDDLRALWRELTATDWPRSAGGS